MIFPNGGPFDNFEISFLVILFIIVGLVFFYMKTL